MLVLCTGTALCATPLSIFSSLSIPTHVVDYASHASHDHMIINCMKPPPTLVHSHKPHIPHTHIIHVNTDQLSRILSLNIAIRPLLSPTQTNNVKFTLKNIKICTYFLQGDCLCPKHIAYTSVNIVHVHSCTLSTRAWGYWGRAREEKRTPCTVQGAPHDVSHLRLIGYEARNALSEESLGEIFLFGR